MQKNVPDVRVDLAIACIEEDMLRTKLLHLVLEKYDLLVCNRGLPISDNG